MICTTFVLVLYLLLIIYGGYWTNVDETDHFLNREYTSVLKGLCCILVVIVHVPSDYQNPLQQAVGGFSQVGVTLYFLFSAYGILTGIRRKPDYLKKFWKNRIPSLMIPFALSSGLKILVGVQPGSGGTYFIFVLLFFYVVTYIAARFFANKKILIVCIVACLYSVVGSVTHWLRWPTQALGFAYGALLAQYLTNFTKWLRCKYWLKLSVITVFSVAFTFIYAVLELPINEFANVMLQNFTVLFLILWVFTLTFRLVLGNPASKYLGDISYDVFLYHGLVQGLLQALDKDRGINFSSGLFLLLMMSFSILLSAGTHVVNRWILEKLKQK